MTQTLLTKQMRSKGIIEKTMTKKWNRYTQDRLIIRARGREYGDLVKDQWTLKDIDNNNEHDNVRNMEGPGDTDNVAEGQGRMNEG
jgi:hypothetical protein